MNSEQDYLQKITINMSDMDVQDVVRSTFGPSWECLNDLEVWTHYDKAYSYRKRLALDQQVSTMIQNQQQGISASSSTLLLSSLESTPVLTESPEDSPASAPPVDATRDFALRFSHAVEFSNFVLAQTRHIYKSSFPGTHSQSKPPIPLSFSYQEVVDAQYIADQASKAMLNPGRFSTNGICCAHVHSFRSMGFG